MPCAVCFFRIIKGQIIPDEQTLRHPNVKKILLSVYLMATALLFPFFLLFVALHTLSRPRAFWHHLQRLSVVLPERRPTPGKRVWLHAVSVGEILSCTPLIQSLQERGWAVFLSTSTESGFATAQKRLRGVELFYFPFDFWFVCNRFLKRINPDIVLLCEVEIWPSFVWSVRRRGIPLYLVSGRMVEKDFRQYRRFKWFFGCVLSMFSGLFMQNDAYTGRMQALCRHPRLKTLGNLKFDAGFDPITQSDIGKLMPAGFNLCAASTHSGDEGRIIRIFQSLRVEFPQLRLVLVPRHPHRKREITRILDTQHISYTLRSEKKYCRTPVFVVDTVGELMEVYQRCEIVIIGGSFSREVGGHNIIEPALLKKCILCGNHMENFEDIYARFKQENALITTNWRDLSQDLRELIQDREKAARMGEKAFAVIRKNRGVSERILAEIF